MAKAKYFYCCMVTSIILFFVSLLIAILVPIAAQFGMEKKVESKVLLKENEKNLWGSIPGAYDVKKSEIYSLYGYSDKNKTKADLLSVTTTGEYEYSVTQTYDNITYRPLTDTITYQANTHYDKKNSTISAVKDGQSYYLNLAALTANYLLSDREDFKEIFVVFRDVADKMITNLVPYVFSMNAYSAAVSDKDITMQSILKGVKNQEEVFSDEKKGFGSIKSLSLWIRALEGGSTSSTYQDLQTHFKLSDKQMDQIIGPSSFIKALYSATQVSYSLEYDCKKFCDNTTMFAIQWASQNVTNNQDLFISPNVKPVESLHDLDSSLFGAPPEFSYAVKKFGIDTDPLNLTQTLGLASIASFTDSSSIFNLKNLYDFISSYQGQRYDNLQIKYKLNSDKQADALYWYMHEYAIPKLANYEDKKGTKQHKSFARLITYTMNKTETYLENFLPEAVNTRYVSSKLVKDKKSCSDFVSKQVKDNNRVTYACQNYDFTTYLGSSQWTLAYVEGKGSSVYSSLQEVTNLTDTEMDKLFSEKDSNSFGKYCSDVLKDIAKFYGCKSTPCSDYDLAHQQFMNATITMNIKSTYKNDDILFPTDSVVHWGYSRGVPLEYDYYAQNKCFDKNGLTESAYELITSGPDRLTEFSNAINFVIDVDHGTNVQNYTEMYGVTADKLLCSLRYLTQDAFLGGLLVPLQDEQIIFGYDAQMLTFLQEGNFTKGSDPSVQTYVAINDVYYNKTLVNDTNVEIFTGNRHPSKVKQSRSINGGTYINNIVPFYNGTNVTYGNLNPLGDNIKVAGTDGLQFKQGIDKDSKVTIFDTRKISDVKFKYSDKKEYDKVRAYKFNFDNKNTKTGNGDNDAKHIEYDGFFNVSSSFKLPIGVSQGFFKQCSSDQYGQVMIDNANPADSQGDVSNFLTLEPESGYMIETKRDELISLNVHEKFLAFPDLEGISGFIPIMRVRTSTAIDQDIFMDRFGFVNTFQDTKFYFRVIFYPFAGLCLIIALFCFLMYRRHAKDETGYYRPDYNGMRGSEEFENENQRLINKTDDNPIVKKDYNSYEAPAESTRMNHHESDGDSSP